MKNLTLTIIALMTIVSGIQAQSDCSKYYPFTEGATATLTMYNKKGKMEGMVEYSVLKLEDKSGATVATMTNKLFDKKGKELNASEYTASCSDGVVSIDFNSLMQPGMLDAFGDIDAEITGTNLELPNNLETGQSLPDAEVNIAISMSGMSMNMKTAVVDRKVIGEETITTPAGTFDCYIITQTTQIKSMASNMSRTGKSWISEGVGVVKSEDYDKKGNLDSSSVLTSFSK